MIKLNFEKEAFYKNQKKTKALFEFQGKKEETKTERRTLNLSISIDISGSMNSFVGSYKLFEQPNFLNGIGANQISNNEKPLTKLEQAKKVAKKAIENMKVGDSISIIAFNQSAEVIVPATLINDSNRENIFKKIDSIVCNGMTNVNEGWLTAAEQVAQNLDSQKINRVLLLSDGQTNTGEVIPDNICNGVSKMKKNSISLSTFGIGSGFNEELLIGMANSGDGNSYYIEVDNKLSEMFELEFNDISNISGTNATLELKLNSGVAVSKQFNNFEVVEGKYIIPNIRKDKAVPFLIELDFDSGQKSKIELGTAILRYKDNEGKEQEVEVTMKQEVVSKKKYESLERNKEIEVQEALIELATEKEKARKFINEGNIQEAQGILRTTTNSLKNLGLVDDRILKEVSQSEETLLKSEKMDSSEFGKTMLYQSYATMRGNS